MATAACAGSTSVWFAAGIRLAGLTLLVTGLGGASGNVAGSVKLTELRSGGQPSSRLPDALPATNGNNDQDRSPKFFDFFPGGPITVDVPGLAGALLMASTSDRNDGIPPPSAVRYFPRHLDGDGRELQTVCEPGDVFSVSSTLIPAAEGCYEEIVEDSFFYVMGSNGRVIVLADISLRSSSNPSSASSSNPLLVWLLGVVIGTSSSLPIIEYQCVSDVVIALDAHPTDSTVWECVVGSEVVEVTGELLSVECGCFGEGEGGTPSPVSASAPTPVGDSGCSGTDSFSITSGTFEDFEGCYVDAGVDSSSFFSRTGQFAGGLEAVFPSFLGDDQQDPRWVVGVYAEEASSTEADIKCLSSQSPAVAHPADSTWFCDLTGTGAFTEVSDTRFSIACDCNSTSSSATDDASQSPTPSRPSSTTSSSGGTDSSSPEPGAGIRSTPNPASADRAAGDTPVPMTLISQPVVDQPTVTGQSGDSGAAVARGAAFGFGSIVAGVVGIVSCALVGWVGLFAVG